MEVLGARPVCLMSDPEKVSTLDAAMAELVRLEALVVQLTAEMERTGYAQEIGARDTARFLSKRYRMDLPKARRTVRLATTLDKYPSTAAALPDPAAPYASTLNETDGSGERHGWRVHPDQAEAIFAVLAKVPASVPIENVDFAEQRLIELAATHTPQQLREAGKPILAILDPDGPEPSEKRAYARESLTWKNSDQGVKFQGFLACENAELFRTVIHSGAKPRKTVDGEPDPRPWSKRQADALTTALSNALPGTRTEGMAAAADGSDLAVAPAQDLLPGVQTDGSSLRTHHSAGPDPADADAGVVAGHGPKTQISVTIDYNDLKSAVAHATGTLMFGDTLSAATVRRLACDAEILPIVLGSKSQPLDVGTSQRLVTQPMRRALNARDKGCVACGAPPNQCEAHHLKHWIDGGITAVSNLVLLCKRDHLDLHSGHWNIQIIDDVVHVTRPPWADPKPIPPNKYRPRLTNPPIPNPTAARSGHRRLSVVDPARPNRHPDNPNNTHPAHPDDATRPRPHTPHNPTQPHNTTNPTAPNSPTGPSGAGGDRWDETAAPVSHLAASAPPWSTAGFNPWGGDPDTNPPPSPVPASTAPWANDPAVAKGPAPTIPWADDPLPVGRPASAPWAEAGFDPWGEDQELNHPLGPEPTSATTQPPPTTPTTLGSVA